jgi:aromatic ring hydroxylase
VRARIYRCLDCDAVLKMAFAKATMAEAASDESWELFEMS